jgi:hypothetical protein
MGLKAVRRTLEKDLGLAEKALDPQKELVASLVDKVRPIVGRLELYMFQDLPPWIAQFPYKGSGSWEAAVNDLA